MLHPAIVTVSACAVLFPAAAAHALTGVIHVNEVCAANASVIADEAGEFDDWLELANHGTTIVNVGGLFLSDDPLATTKWEIPSASLGPGEHLLIWADEDQFQGTFHTNFKLDAQGEEVMLFDTLANGNAMLDRVVFGLQSQDVSVGRVGGSEFDVSDYLIPPTPGAANSGAALFSDICINEFLTTSAGGGIDDWIELYNRGSSSIDISGWGISDDVALPMKFAVPASTTIAAGGFYFVNEIQLGFSLSSAGERIMVTGSDGVTGFDFYEFGPQTADVSSGRFHDGESRWFAFAPPTPNSSNLEPIVAVPVVGPTVVIGAAPLVNPSSGASVAFTLLQPGDTRVSVFDSTGRRVHLVATGERRAGNHVVSWDGRTASGRVAAGRYWVLIESGSESVSVPISITR